MKNKYKIWYTGYIVSFLLILIILFTDLSKTADIGLTILFCMIFAVSHVQVLHNSYIDFI